MRPLTQRDIIEAFAARQRKHLVFPSLDNVAWNDLDYFGWTHVSGHMAFVVFEDDQERRGIVLRKTKSTGAQRPKMCSWCLTVHRGCGVNLFTVQNASDKNKIYGDYICNDLQCSLYIRGIKATEACQMREHVDIEFKIRRLRDNIKKFIQHVHD